MMYLKPGCEPAYLAAHEAVWPELIEAATEAGIRNHSVFNRGLELFVYIEAEDVDASLEALSKREVKQRWDAKMAELLDPARPPITLAEAFHMD